ncbi:MAG: RsiV family protein [Lawsonibacter sp.]|jgi:hypothetical protein
MRDDRLESMRGEYHSIPIPDQLEFRVRSSIQQAKRDCNPSKNTKGGLYRVLKRTGLTTAAAMLGIVILANASPSVAYAMEQVPVLGAITRVFTFRTYEYQGDKTSAHIEVPQVEGGSQELNEAIVAYTDTIIQQYQQDAGLYQGAPEGETDHYLLDLTYTVVTDNDTLFALRFDQTEITASGVESAKVYNVDKRTGEILTLEDLFQPNSSYLEVLTQAVQEQMAQRMEQDEEQYYWLDDPVEAWNFTQLSPDADFYVDEQGDLVLVFDEGEVAPMYMGLVEFTIPAKDLEGLAIPDYLG